MFTNESIVLRDYFFNRSEVTETKELKLLYNHLQLVKLLPMHITYRKYEYIKKEIKLPLHIPFSVVERNIFQKSSVRFIINKLRVTVNIYDEKTKEDLMNQLIHVIRFLVSLSKIKITKLVLNYYLFDDKKVLENNYPRSSLERNEINSGYCQGDDITTITIYRKEELIKVTIHELIHALKYDHPKDSLDIINYYRKKYNITSNIINTHEAYTEICANIINCFLISQKVRRSQYNLFLLLIALEREFCKFQCEKIMYLSDLSKKEIDINENTNVLSYFIIRCELYQKLTQFLKFCRIHNQDYIQLYKKDEWYKLLKKKSLIKPNNKRFNNIDEQGMIFNTMRMSLNELLI